MRDSISARHWWSEARLSIGSWLDEIPVESDRYDGAWK